MVQCVRTFFTHAQCIFIITIINSLQQTKNVGESKKQNDTVADRQPGQITAL